MEKPELQIAGICGSLRKKSYNRQLLNTAISLGQQEGINIVPVEIGNLPLYNADQISTGEEIFTYFSADAFCIHIYPLMISPPFG